MTDKKEPGLLLTKREMVIAGVLVAVIAVVTSLSYLRGSALAPPAPPPAAPSAPPASASAKPPPVPVPAQEKPKKAKVEWAYVSDPAKVLGRWIDAEHGDAIPKGPAGGKIVVGGVRMDVVQRPGSKTPFNLTFWAPSEGHETSATISGGCGFYPPDRSESMTTFCRGYGLDTAEGAFKTSLSMQVNGDRLRVAIDGVVTVELRGEP